MSVVSKPHKPVVETLQCNVSTPTLSPAFDNELGWLSYRHVTVERWRNGIHSEELDYVAEEVPVVLVYNNQPHVVMLASPTNLEDFATGFSLTEGIVQTLSEVLAIKVIQRSKGVEVRIQIPPLRFDSLHNKGKNMTGRTGCGLCGATTLEQAIRRPKPVDSGFVLNAALLANAFIEMQQKQSLNRLSGSVHAAAWLHPGKPINILREDVGRHNALDKVIGALLKSHTDFNQGCLLVTSRASYEMVQKAASVGISLLAAISAPTGLAIRLAEECGLTLVGFVRGDNCVIYTHSHRLQHI